MEIQVDRVESDYGMQDELLRGELGWVSYGGVYGGDNGEVIFDTGKDGDNILIFGNSYDNAILKLLASHFSKTYSIDLRNYELVRCHKILHMIFRKAHCRYRALENQSTLSAHIICLSAPSRSTQ